MLGEVAWDHLFEPKLFESSVAKERALMQRQILYDAWKYLKAKDPLEVARLRRQLEEGDPRRKALARESQKVRNLRSRVQKSRRRELLESGRPAKSIESDSDSESGYESGDSSQMPPPPPPRPAFRRPAPRRPGGGSPDVLDGTMMSGVRGASIASSGGADDDELEEGSRRGAGGGEASGGGSAGAGSQRPSASAPAPRGTKRKLPTQSESQQNSGPRIYQQGGRVFVTETPPVTQQHTVDGEERAVDGEERSVGGEERAVGDEERAVHDEGRAGHDGEHAVDDQEDRAVHDEDDNLLNEEGFNGGRDQRSAMAEAQRDSRATSQRRNMRDRINGGLGDEEALRAAIRASQPPDEARNEANAHDMRARSAAPRDSIDLSD